MEKVVFVEFQSKTRPRLEPYQVITKETKQHGTLGETWDSWLWYDCDTMKDGVLLYHCSGSGSPEGDFAPYTGNGPYWAAKGIKVNNSEGARRLARLPKRFSTWPPNGLYAIEAPIVYCDTCGALPDDDSLFELDEGICPHLEWDGHLNEWVPLRQPKTFKITVEQTNRTEYIIQAADEDAAREILWDSIDRQGLDDENTEDGPITIIRIERD